MPNPRSAFTLIELSIVIVIIGLIVGGVLVGRDLIRAAEMRQQVSQIEQISTAINTFRLKYNCLPGDCLTATQFFGASTQPNQVSNGNGDGYIKGYDYLGTTSFHINGGIVSPGTNENGFLWDHLAAANLSNNPQFNENTTNDIIIPSLPEAKLQSPGKDAGVSMAFGHVYRPGRVLVNSIPGFLYIQTATYIEINACQAFEGVWFPPTVTNICGLNPDDALSLDTKIDDGKPYSGTIVLAAGNYIYQIPGSAAYGGYDNTINCGNFAQLRYLRMNELPTSGGEPAYKGCHPIIKTSF